MRADACVKEAANAEELEHARELFWQHLEVRCTSSELQAAVADYPSQGNDCPLQRQTRPGKPGKQDVPVEEQEWGQRWDRNDVTTWRDGHGDGLLTSGTHCGTSACFSRLLLGRHLCAQMRCGTCARCPT